MSIGNKMIIDLEDPITYSKNPTPNSINVPYDKLMFNHKDFLDKNNTYYLTCSKGRKSKRAVEILSYYGYKVKQYK